jgi:hypothetical protein
MLALQSLHLVLLGGAFSVVSRATLYMAPKIIVIAVKAFEEFIKAI